MAKIVLLVAFAATQVADGVAVAGFNMRAVDSAGTVLVSTVSIGQIGPLLQGDGTGSYSNQLDGDAAPGPFSGVVQAVDASGANIGSAVSFTGTVPAAAPAPAPAPVAPNMQPLPTSVTVTVNV